MASLSNKVFVVTGAASGMGLATAKLLLARGASLGLADLNEKGLESFVQSLDADTRRRTLTGVVNVTNCANVASFLQSTKAQFDRLHGIANFAGVAGHKLGLENIWDISDEEFSFIIDANVKGAFNILAEGLKPGLLEDNEGDNSSVGSSIVHITSMFSERGYPKGSVFTASKHGAVGLIKAAAMESGSRGIRVNALLPGAIETPMRQVLIDYGAPPPIANTPLDRPGTSEEIANVAAFLLSDESSYVTGASWTVDGGANAG